MPKAFSTFQIALGLGFDRGGNHQAAEHDRELSLQSSLPIQVHKDRAWKIRLSVVDV